jgi:protocatechuate 3,4-dioxygenase beta subunit
MGSTKYLSSSSATVTVTVSAASMQTATPTLTPSATPTPTPVPSKPTATPTPTPTATPTLQQTAVTAISSNSNPLTNQQFSISGTLKDTNGVALPNKQIVIIHEDPTGTWSNIGATTTSTSGAYTLTLSEPTRGIYKYEIWFQGDATYNKSFAGCQVLIGTYQKTELTMFTTRSTATIGQPFTLNGFLTDTNGAPLSNKQVTLWRRDPTGQDTAIATTTTAANGSYSFTRSESSQGSYWYWGKFAGDENYESCQNTNGWIFVAIGNLKSATITMATSNANPSVNEKFTISGYLRDANGVGISGKTIMLFSRLPTGEWPQRGSYVTNAAGFYTFTLSEPSAGDYWYEAQFMGDADCTASLQGLHEHVGVMIPTSLSLSTSNSNPTTNQQFTLYGYFKDVNGNPIAGDQIDWYRRDSSGQTFHIASRVTDTNGYYSFTWSEAQPGQYVYTVASNGYQNYAVSVTTKVLTVR